MSGEAWSYGDFIVFILAVVGLFTILTSINNMLHSKRRGGYQPKTSVDREKPPNLRPRPTTPPPEPPKGQGIGLEGERYKLELEIAELKRDIAHLRTVLESKGNGT